VRRFVECDGWETHGTPQALTADLERQNALVLAGWVPLRFSWRTVKDRPGLVATQITAALRAAAEHA
jgi:very-short-patch-repair endonuclease